MLKLYPLHLSLAGLLLTLFGLFGSCVTAHARKEDPARYVVTLLTAEAPPEPERIAQAQPAQTYVSSFKRDGKVLYRLRLGFFVSRKAAEDVMRTLRARYPKSWVTRVPKKEKQRVLAGEPDPRLPLDAENVVAGR